MINIQGPGSLKKMCGLAEDGSVSVIPDLRFARKHLTNPKEKTIINQCKRVFSFVSSPLVYKDKQVIKNSSGWCHALRNPERILPDKPRLFLPESDFMDPMFVPYVARCKQFKYDFFYYTLNSKAGIENKGLDIFCKSLEVLCGKLKLKGLVVVYFPNVPRFKEFKVLSSKQIQQIKKHNKYLTFMWGKQSPEQMANIASMCKFGFFPNTIDNSPRTLSETLIRDVPVLINRNIHGGWHYANEHTGSLFDLENLEKSAEYVISRTFSPREYFMSQYGFEKSSKKLAEFVQSVYKISPKITHMYFSQFADFLEKIKP